MNPPAAGTPSPSGPPSHPSPGRPPLAPRHTVREVGMAHPLYWLARGISDVMAAPLPALVHGLASALFGAALFVVARHDFWILAGAFSGFLLVAPIVATGLYAVSRAISRGERPTLGTALAVWRTRDPRLIHFGVLLAFAGTGWVLTSASLVTSFAELPIAGPSDFVVHVVLSHRSWLFEVWLVLGALLAAPVFASSVVAIPLLLDRRTTVLQAVLTSWMAVLASPGPLALWAGLILVLTTVGMATALVGLVFVVPWLAHASWHAYVDLVEPDPPPEPDAAEAR